MAFVINNVNTKHLYHSSEIEWFSFQKNPTADDVSYLKPADNFLEKGVWKDNSLGYSSYYQRSPGYGILYLTFKMLFNKKAIPALLIFQSVFFGVSVYLFGLIILLFTKQVKTTLFFQLLYGLLPSSYGFVFYTITEGITPFLMISFLFVLIKIYNNFNLKKYHYILAFICLVMISVRPQLLPFLFIYPFLIIYKKELNKSTIKNLILYFAISSFGLNIWLVRGYLISGHTIGLASIYDNTNNSQFRPPHKAFSNLYRIWEHQPEKLHGSLVPIWVNTITGQPKKEDILFATSNLPNYVTTIISTKKWNKLFSDYQATIEQQKIYYDKQIPMPPNLLKDEIKLISKIDSFNIILRNKLWYRNYFVTPINSYIKTTVHSNLNLYIFQNTYRGYWLSEVIRWISFIILSGSLLVSIWVWLFRVDVLIRFISITIFCYTFYLVFIQRMNETRYMHPIYPLTLFIMAYLFTKIKKIM